jgi:hypothetical protein
MNKIRRVNDPKLINRPYKPTEMSSFRVRPLSPSHFDINVKVEVEVKLLKHNAKTVCERF